jgi:hypothetical protein
MYLSKRLLIILGACVLSLKIEANPVAAGVLAYTYRNDGNAYFLLAYDPLKVQESGAWTDLGGTIDKGEEPAETAYREFAEESRGVFGNADVRNPQEGNYASDDMLKKSSKYAQSHITGGPFISPKNRYHEYIAFVQDMPSNVLEDSTPHIDQAYPEGTDVVPFFAWVKAHTLINLVKSNTAYPQVPTDLIAHKKDTEFYLGSLLKKFKKPTPKLYGDFVGTLRNSHENNAQNIDRIASIVLQPTVGAFLYSHNSDGTTDVIVSKNQSQQWDIFTIKAQLSENITVKDALTKALDNPKKEVIDLNDELLSAPPVDLLVYSGKLSTDFLGALSAEKIKMTDFIQWTKGKSTQKVKTRSGLEINLPEKLHQVFSTVQGAQHLEKITTGNVKETKDKSEVLDSGTSQIKPSGNEDTGNNGSSKKGGSMLSSIWNTLFNRKTVALGGMILGAVFMYKYLRSRG